MTAPAILRHLDYPPVWLALFIGIAWALAQLWAPLGDGLAPVGWALIAAGLVLVFWAALTLRRARTTIVPRERPTALVTGGPYRFSRNPIYLADLMILAGVALVLGAPQALLLLWPFTRVLERRFIEPEEAALAAAFGPDWERYRARVRRWL